MNFNLTNPCEHCPFRNDIDPFLTTGRAEEIVEAIVNQQGTFPCHKTTVPSDEDDDGGGGMMVTKKSEHCAGAMIMLEHMQRPNQLMRISERLGGYDMMKMNMDAPVFKNGYEFIEAQRPRRDTVPDHDYDDIE